ncbi:MAG: acyltransferase [Chitinophagales bacterium]
MLKSLLHLETNPHRVFGLDVLRAAAILFVVLEHADFLLPAKYRFITRYVVFDGVTIFFVLSGFLIGGILIRELEHHEPDGALLLHFWKRRWMRTLPNYFLILVVLLLLHLFFTPGFNTVEHWRYFLFAQNLNSPHPYFFAEAWSLCVEEWFYLALPVLMGLLLRGGHLSVKRALLLSAVLMLLFAVGMRVLHFYTIPVTDQKTWDLVFRKQVSTRFDSLMIGVAAAWVTFYFPSKWRQHRFVFLFCGLALLLFSRFVAPLWFDVSSFYNGVLSFLVGSLGTVLLLPLLSEWKANASIPAKVITHISLISYSMYLLNLSVLQYWVIDRLPWQWVGLEGLGLGVLKYGTLWVLVLLSATLLYQYFELPMMKRREKSLK